MRSNHRPAVALSELPPDQVNLRSGEVLAVACPVCGRWRRVKRRMLWPHRAHDGVRRCPGSGQRVLVDLTPAQWRVRLEAARREAASQTVRRAGPTSGGPPTRSQQHAPSLDEATRAALAAAPDILAARQARREPSPSWPRNVADRRQAAARRHGLA